MIEFEFTDEHMKLLRAMYVDWEDGEAGAPAINCKRPYGNSDIHEDIAEVLGWELFEDADGQKHLSKSQRDRAEKLHKETKDALQIFLLWGRSPGFGVWVKEDRYLDHSWKQKQPAQGGGK